MSKKIRSHLRSNVIGYLALFFALSGTAAALSGSNTVFSDDIAPGEVHVTDIGVNAVTSGKISPNSVTTGKIATSAVIKEKLAPGSVNTGKVINNSLRSDDVLDGSLTGADIANDSITPAQTTGLVGSSSVLWAVVQADGTVVRSSNGLATGAHDGTGNYEIEFSAGNLDPCASIAQISRSFFTDGAPGPGEAASNQGELVETTIDVRTFNSAGTAADSPFTVHVLCGSNAGAGPTKSSR